MAKTTFLSKYSSLGEQLWYWAPSGINIDNPGKIADFYDLGRSIGLACFPPDGNNFWKYMFRPKNSLDLDEGGRTGPRSCGILWYSACSHCFYCSCKLGS